MMYKWPDKTKGAGGGWFLAFYPQTMQAQEEEAIEEDDFLS